MPPPGKSLSSTKGEQTNAKTASNGPAAPASAPSEQELKEEEELQLALALSLSETPVKFSFPDLRPIEDALVSSSGPVGDSNNKHGGKDSTAKSKSNEQQSSIRKSTTGSVMPQDGRSSSTGSQRDETTTEQSLSQVPQSNDPLAQQPSNNYNNYERDNELFKYVAEVQSTLEIFNNRIYACKLRNRPITNDTAIEGLFLKLSSDIQPRLAEYIKKYEDERAYYERLQDKLSQIADARAALDALREEHQEKVRQQAAEAERQRQSQLALKLEAMRQKKSQMMQYQRELALQRIREQEMGGSQPMQQPSQQQPTPQAFQAPTPTSIHQPPTSISVHQPPTSADAHQPPASIVTHQPPIPTGAYQPQVPHYSYDLGHNHQQAPVQQQQQPVDEDAPLISFDE